MPEDNIAVTFDTDTIFREIERKSIRKEQEERRRYFLNQKLIGAFLLAAAVLLSVLVDLTCIIGAIPAVGIIASKKMVIVNDYWRTHGGAGQWSQDN